MMKKAVSLLLIALILLLSTVYASAAAVDIAESGETIFAEGDWVYQAIDGGSHWELDKYTGNDSDLAIPRLFYERMVVAIGSYCFLDNTTVKNVETSSPLWTVGEYAFLNCTSLESFECNFALKEICAGAFSGTTALQQINLEDSAVTVIRPHVFTNSGIQEVTLPDTCSEIMHDAFSQCAALQKVVVPRSVTTIDAAAFARSENVVIYCYTDSYAHQYAVAHEIPFVLIDAPQEFTFILGDSDGDGVVTIIDATKVQRVLAGLDPDDDGMIALRSVTESGEPLNIMDATRIQRYLAGFEADNEIGNEVTRVKYYQA